MHQWWLLAIATLITGLCYGIQQSRQWIPRLLPASFRQINDYFASLFPAILFVFLIRTFLIDFCVIPSASMQPNLLVGDRIIASRLAYGIRFPITGIVIKAKLPKRGDVIIFRYPLNPSVYFIKRVIGLPGDRIHYDRKQLTINGKAIPQQFLSIERKNNHEIPAQLATHYQEDLYGQKYSIYTDFAPNEKIDNAAINKPTMIIVPPKHYFVMGDNRDNSFDSRKWGCVPDYYLSGKAKWIFFSSDKQASWFNPLQWVRWSRLGMTIR